MLIRIPVITQTATRLYNRRMRLTSFYSTNQDMELGFDTFEVET
jgi:hypothetical protein